MDLLQKAGHRSGSSHEPGDGTHQLRLPGSSAGTKRRKTIMRQQKHKAAFVTPSIVVPTY